MRGRRSEGAGTRRIRPCALVGSTVHSKASILEAIKRLHGLAMLRDCETLSAFCLAKPSRLSTLVTVVVLRLFHLFKTSSVHREADEAHVGMAALCCTAACTCWLYDLDTTAHRSVSPLPAARVTTCSFTAHRGLIDVAEILIQDQFAKWQLECRRGGDVQCSA